MPIEGMPMPEAITETGTLTSQSLESGVVTNMGNVIVNGQFVGAIDNSKVVVADSDKECLFIVMMRDGATFDFKKPVTLASFSTDSVFVIDLAVANVYNIIVSADSDFGGVKVSGTPTAGAEAGVLDVLGNVLFNEDMTFPKDVSVEIDDAATLRVTSYITMIDNEETAPIEGYGTLTVTDDGVVKTAVPLVIRSPTSTGLYLNAVYYMKDNFHYYTTLKNALAAQPDYIKVYGDIVFDTDTIIPNGMWVDMTEANSITISKNATVTVKDGGIFENGNVPIDVQGTLILENTPTSKTNVEIVESDVKVESGITTKFTNLKRALEEAQSGDVIFVKRAHVYISEDTVIPEGVTLKIGSGHIVELIDGAKLTVNGTLDAHPGVYTITNGTTVVNGLFIFDEPFETYTSKIAGAYCVLDGVNTITSLGYLAGKESGIKDIVYMYGANTAGDVSLTGDKFINVMPGSSLSVDRLSLDDFVFDALDADSVSGKIVAGNGAVTFESAKGFLITQDGRLLLNGEVEPAVDRASMTFSGDCVVEDAVKPGVTVAFENDANVTLNSDFTFYEDVYIPDGATVRAMKSVTAQNVNVAGVFNVTDLAANDVVVSQSGALGNIAESVKLNAESLTVDGSVLAGNESAFNLGRIDLSGGKVAFGDYCSLDVGSDVTSLDNLTAGEAFSLHAKNIKLSNGNFGNYVVLKAEENLDLGSVTCGDTALLSADTMALKNVVIGNSSYVKTVGDLDVTGNTTLGEGASLEVGDDMNVSGNMTISSKVKAVVNGFLDVSGTLKTVATAVNEKDSFTVKKDANVSGDLDLSVINLVKISGDLNVVGKATMGSFSTSTVSGGTFVYGNTSVASTGVLTIPEKTIWACFKDLTVDGKFIVGKNSTAAVGSSLSSENGTVAVAGSAETATGSLFTATNLVLPGTFTNSGNVIIGALDIDGTSTIDGTVNAKDGTFTMYRTVYITGDILTDKGKFVASKIYAGVNESIFGYDVAPATSVPTLGSGVSLTSAGVAYVSPAVRTNGCFDGFKHTDYYKGNDHYLTVFANPSSYSDKADGKNRNIDSIYATAEDAYVNGWRATKEVKSAAEAANARITSPYGTYETVWMNSVYEIYNFKLYAADETATPMVGKLENGQWTPLTLYKSGLNCYESPVNLKAGTYRVTMTYADGHQEQYIDNPMVVNGVPQSNYDFTFSGNPENKEQVDYLIQFSFSEEDPPVVVDKSLSLTDILLIVLVILIIVVVIVLILRARRS